MNRFEKAKKDKSIWYRVLFPIAGFLLILVLFFYGMEMLERSSEEQQYENLSASIQKCVVHCYATEGFYPPSLDYLLEHYGLTYNEDLFFIDYQPTASNLLPEVTIIRREVDL